MSTTDLRKTNVRRRLGDILVEKGYLRPEQLQAALEQQRSSGRTRLLGEILLSLGYCSEEQIAECLAEEYGLPFTRLEMRLFDQKIVDLLPREYIEKQLRTTALSGSRCVDSRRGRTVQPVSLSGD